MQNNWRPSPTSRGAACTLIILVRCDGDAGFKEWHKNNKFEDLNESDVEFILDNLEKGSIRDWVIDRAKLD